jgi:hypothetical protein
MILLAIALAALIYFAAMWCGDRHRRREDDKIARELRAYSDEYNRGR